MTLKPETWNKIFAAAIQETSLLADLAAGCISDNTGKQMHEIASREDVKVNNMQHLLTILGRLAPSNIHVSAAWKEYKAIVVQRRQRIKWAKQHLAKAAGWKDTTPHTWQALASELGIRPIYRPRCKVPGAKQFYSLVDPGNEFLAPIDKRQNGKVFVVGKPADENWYTVGPDESAIFLNPTTGAVELVVIRKATGLDAHALEYFQKIIHEAGRDRRTCRPGHGTLIQAGWNAGPRHKRVWGFVNNMKKEVAADVKYAKDKDILGILAFTWNLILAKMPRDIMEPVLAAIKESEMPEMSAPGFTDHPGYTMSFAGEELYFPAAERAPAEGYLAEDYHAHIHKDNAFAQFGFFWNITHINKDPRSRSHWAGGNFADIPLGVTVVSAADTLVAFQPEFFHGTTIPHPKLYRAGTAITFSEFIRSTFKKAMENFEKGELIGMEITEYDEKGKAITF